MAAELECNGGTARPDYELADLDGDGAVDLITTDDCASGGLGESTWRVFFNDGAAFAANGTDIAIPGAAYAGNESIDDLSSDLECFGTNEDEPAYGLRDLNGDGLLDLVITETCVAGSGTGESSWEVYFNVGGAFDAAATTWSVPGSQYPGAMTFERFAEAQDCAGVNDQPTYELLDLNGDGLPELVILDACDTGARGDIGEVYWAFYPNTGTGFDASSARWDIPGRLFRGPESLDAIAGTLTCQTGLEKPEYAVLDLDGDAAVDIVVLDLCNDTVVGETQWNLGYGATCAP